MKIQLCTLLLSVSLFQILVGLSASGQCLDDQKSLLVQLKNSLKYNSKLSTKLVEWNESTDCCNWEGVSCNTGGHVIGLDLNNESISATGSIFSSSLSGLQYLKRLNLAYNKFNSSQVPAGVFSLTNLTYLNLSTAGFIGTFPSWIANLTQLVVLDFWSNKFSGEISSTHFESLVNLEYMDLGSNLLSGTIPSSLFGLPSTRKLFLSYNNFHGSLPNFTNPQLDTFFASWNNLSGSIPVSFLDLKSLRRTSLSYNKLSGEFELQNLDRFSNLTYFNLSYNNLSVVVSRPHENSTKFLPPLLKDLKLNSCRMQHFPDVRHNPSLITLDIGENQISGDIPNWIWDIGNGGIQYLNLSLNQLEKLQEPYVIHDNLSWIDLRSNRLSGEIPMPPQNVYFVDYSDNFFTSTIPTNINLTSAMFFSVSGNRLSGTIPVSICRGTNLQLLDLSNNYLTGNIPSCLFEFSQTLTLLKLGNNSLTGNISGIFKNDCGLQTLDLHENLIQGNVPESLANCANLEVLNLGNNQINDSFPCFLKNSSSLHVLVLHSNVFHGGINCQDTNGSWPNLQIIDIASNYFTGNLSYLPVWQAMKYGRNEVNILGFDFPSFSNSRKTYQDAVTITIKGRQLELDKILTIFTSVDISNNRFEGNIPDTIGELKSLVSLNLSHNTLTGSIPTSIGNLKLLETLDLSVNKLNGKIPQELSEISFLAVLDLSYNQLTGKIPTGSQIQTFPETSFRGNKGLCGPPLQINCSGVPVTTDYVDGNPPDNNNNNIKWQFVAPEVGFAVGLGIVILPLLFYKRWRYFYYERVDQILSRVFRMKQQNTHGRIRRRNSRIQRR